MHTVRERDTKLYIYFVTGVAPLPFLSVIGTYSGNLPEWIVIFMHNKDIKSLALVGPPLWHGMVQISTHFSDYLIT